MKTLILQHQFKMGHFGHKKRIFLKDYYSNGSTIMMRKYTKYPKNIRFDEVILNEAEVYMRQTGMSFSDLVRLALQMYLKRKLYSGQ